MQAYIGKTKRMDTVKLNQAQLVIGAFPVWRLDYSRSCFAESAASCPDSVVTRDAKCRYPLATKHFLSKSRYLFMKFNFWR